MAINVSSLCLIEAQHSPINLFWYIAYLGKTSLHWLFGELITQTMCHEEFFVIFVTILLVLLGSLPFSNYMVFLFIIKICIIYFII